MNRCESAHETGYKILGVRNEFVLCAWCEQWITPHGLLPESDPRVQESLWGWEVR